MHTTYPWSSSISMHLYNLGVDIFLFSRCMASRRYCLEHGSISTSDMSIVAFIYRKRLPGAFSGACLSYKSAVSYEQPKFFVERSCNAIGRSCDRLYCFPCEQHRTTRLVPTRLLRWILTAKPWCTEYCLTTATAFFWLLKGLVDIRSSHRHDKASSDSAKTIYM